jgi:selenocysteine lyase/cysteine desulfurase
MMRIHRRRFLQGAGLLAGLAPLSASRAPAEAAPADDTAFRFESWPRLRDEFAQDWRWRNFAGFLLASRPRIVEQSIRFHRDALNRNAPGHLEEVYRLEAEGRARAAAYLGVDTKQISMTGNTTMGLATLYNQIRIRPGQEVLTTEHEHYSCRTSIEYRARREGFRVRTIRLYDEPRDASTGGILERIRRNVTPATRVLALTWVHSGSSIKLPAAAVGRLVTELNQGRGDDDRILFCLDGVHGFGVENTRFDELGCDFFVAGTHKWMFGPSGTGIMCSRDPELRDISPTIPPFNFGGDESFGAMMTPGGFHTFEHRASVGKAFEFHLAIGKQRVQERIHALNERLKQQLEALDGVELVTPRGAHLSAGFTFFRVPGKGAEEVEAFLRAERIIASAADRDAGPVVRMAPGLMNSEEEIDAAVAALRRLA